MNINVEFYCHPGMNNESHVISVIQGIKSVEVEEDLFSRKRYESNFLDIITIAGVLVNVGLLIVSIKQLFSKGTDDQKSSTVNQVIININNERIDINSENYIHELKKLEKSEMDNQ